MTFETAPIPMQSTASRMQLVETIDEMRHVVADARTKGQSIAFVPTMGALHEGHLTLVDEAKRVAEVVVMSVFVNPLQFALGEDYERYPRDEPRDLTVCERLGVDVVWSTFSSRRQRRTFTRSMLQLSTFIPVQLVRNGKARLDLTTSRASSPSSPNCFT